MLKTFQLSLLLFITTLLFSCATTQISPEQVLLMQEREETIINEQLSRKLGAVEGIWLQGGSNQTIAIYKRGDNLVAYKLVTGKILFMLNKTNEFEYYGDCKLQVLYETIKGKFRLVSVDDDTIDYICARENYITALNKSMTNVANMNRCLFCKRDEPDPQDLQQQISLTRVYPENLKEHNSQY